jgi:hypothetical protein
MIHDYSCGLIAHGGGNLNPRMLSFIGIAMLIVGAGLIIRDLSNSTTSRKRSGFAGLLLILLGYAFLASGQNLPGRKMSLLLFGWLVALPILLLPWLFWNLRLQWKTKAAPTAQLPLLSSESLEDKACMLLRSGESLLWVGVPQIRSFTPEIIAYLIFGLIPFTASSFFLYLLLGEVWKNGVAFQQLPGFLVGMAAALGFFTLGIVCFLYPFKMQSRLSEVVYILTDQRAIVLTSPKLFWNPVPAYRLGETTTEFSSEQVREYERKLRDFTRTDLIFCREWRKARRGGNWHEFGFLGVSAPDQIEQLIRMHFLPA